MYKRIKQNTNSMNPANLRWKYVIESLIEETKEYNTKLKKQLIECLESLAKFPLVLEVVTHCAILEGFNANIIALMKSKINLESKPSEDDIQWRPLRNLENWNLSPIAKRQESGMLIMISWYWKYKTFLSLISIVHFINICMVTFRKC